MKITLYLKNGSSYALTAKEVAHFIDTHGTVEAAVTAMEDFNTTGTAKGRTAGWEVSRISWSHQ